MKVAEYMRTYYGALESVRFLRGALLGSIALNVLLAIVAITQSTTVVLVPPTLTTESRVGADRADAAMQIAWGLWLVNLIANVTPASAPLVREVLGRHLAPEVYQQVMAVVDEQTRIIEREYLSVSFRVTRAFFHGPSHRVVITGEHETSGPRMASQRGLRTYELGFRIERYQPFLTAIEVYDGGPRKLP